MKTMNLKFKKKELDDHQKLKNYSTSIITRMLLIIMAFFVTIIMIRLNAMRIIEISSNNDLRSFMMANFIYIIVMFCAYPIIGIIESVKSFCIIFKGSNRYKKYIFINIFYVITYIFHIIVIIYTPIILNIKV